MSMGYRVNVRPLHEREQIIAAQRKSPLRKVQNYDVYEGNVVDLEVIRLPLDLPIYRTANGRTQTEQLAYIHANNLPEDFFLAGEENETVQQVQHQILWRFAQAGSKSITPIAKVLQSEQQREPILITPRGVIVNGNRRMAAIREIYHSNSRDFPQFATVECAVLPALTPNEIVELEVRLQMRPETKLDYGWIDECLMIQRLIDSGKDENEVARLVRKRPKDVKASLSALNEAEIYLRDWLKKPRDYRQVKDDEQFFYDLPNRLKGKNGQLLEASRRIGWLLVENSDELGQRVYSFNAMFGSKAADVLSRLADRVDLDISSVSDREGASTNDLEVDLGNGSEQGPDYTSLIGAMNDEGRRQELREELVAICQTMIDASRTAEQGRRALVAIGEANTRLAEVDLTRAAPDTYAAIARQLDEIVRRVEGLQTKLQAYQSGRAKKPN